MPGRGWLGHFRLYPGSGTPWWFRLFIAAISGVALSFSYTGFYLSIYSWVCVAVLLIVLFGATARVAFFCGYVHALAFVFTSVPWIGEVLAVHGGLPKAGGWGVLFLIASVWGIGNGAATWAINRLSRRSVTLACLGAPFYWVSLEMFRTYLPEISFPWNLLGYPAAGNLALAQMTTLTGIYGLSFVVAGFNALLAWSNAEMAQPLRRRLLILAGVAAGILLLALVGPHLVPVPTAAHFARGVQVNFPEVEEYPSDWWGLNQADLAEIQRLSLAPSEHATDLLVWPEAPAPFSYQDIRFARMATDLAVKFRNPFIMGVIEWKPETVSTGGKPHVILAP
jgi:apolipoprotein N-acyltransferase